MKYLNTFKLFESLSDVPEWNDYVTDFSDAGFDINFSKINSTETQLKGTLKNKKLEIKEVHDWFSVMLNRFSDTHIILFSQTYFNDITNNYNFTIKIGESLSDLDSISIGVGRSSVEWIPIAVTNYKPSTQVTSSRDIRISGRLKNNADKTLYIYSDGTTTRFSFGNRGTGIKIDKENLNKLVSLMTSGQVKITTSNLDSISKFLNELIIK
jgi:hypothetical protein